MNKLSQEAQHHICWIDTINDFPATIDRKCYCTATNGADHTEHEAPWISEFDKTPEPMDTTTVEYEVWRTSPVTGEEVKVREPYPTRTAAEGVADAYNTEVEENFLMESGGPVKATRKAKYFVVEATTTRIRL